MNNTPTYFLTVENGAVSVYDHNNPETLYDSPVATVSTPKEWEAFVVSLGGKVNLLVSSSLHFPSEETNSQGVVDLCNYLRNNG